MTATRLIAYAPNGASLGPLPTPQNLQAGFPLNDIGALTVDYPVEAPRADLLGEPIEVAVEVSWDGGDTWVEPESARFVYLRDGRDPVRTGDAYQVECPGYVWRLGKALVGFSGLNSEGNREFTTATPGTILKTLWDEAQARGALTAMTLDVSATGDTAGTPWPTSLSIAYEPGTPLLSILMGMAADGLVDFRTQGRTVQVYVADHASGMGADQTVIPNPVTLRWGRDLTEAPFRRTWEGLADVAMVLGDNNANTERTAPAAVAPWGRQETFVTASGVTDQGTLAVIGDATLATTSDLRSEHTFGLEFGSATHLPFRDYAPGEWVYAATNGTDTPERMRVQQVTLVRNEAGVSSGNAVLNDRFLEADVAQQRRIQQITGGATASGGGTTPTTSPGGSDILAPAAATGLAGTSTAYVSPDGVIRSQVTLNWDDVTTNVDGTVIGDLDHYEVWARETSASGSVWTHVADTEASAWTNSPYTPVDVWEFRVRAVDGVFNRGGYSSVVSVTMATDSTPPPKPQTPLVASRLGALQVTWGGRTTLGGAMPADFAYAAVHASTTSGFDPAESNRVAVLRSGGQVAVGNIDYGATYYVKVVAWDTSGNASTPSDQVTHTVAPLVDVSNFPDDAMDELYARTAHFIDLTADQLVANNVLTTALNTVDLSTVNLEAVNIDGGAINIAAGIASTLAEEFAAPNLPAGWVWKEYDDGDGTKSVAVITPGASLGANGSVLDFNYGPAGVSDWNTSDWQSVVEIPLSSTADGEVRVKFRTNGTAFWTETRHTFAEQLFLMLRYQENADHGFASPPAYRDSVWFNILPTRYNTGGVTSEGNPYPITCNFALGYEEEGSSTYIDHTYGSSNYDPEYDAFDLDPSAMWVWAALRVEGSNVMVRVWPDGRTPPPWTVYQGIAIPPGGGTLAIATEMSLPSADDPTVGRRVFIDRVEAEGFSTGFQVKPDGTGDWPYITGPIEDRLTFLETVGAWRTVGTSGNPNFLNGFTQRSANSVQFRKNAAGDQLTITADLNVPTDGHGKTIFLLPAGYRPAVSVANMYAWHNSSGTRLGLVNVEPDGAVTWWNGGNPTGTRSIFTVNVPLTP